MAVQCQDFGRKDDCSSVDTRAGKSKSLIRWKRLKGGKRREKAEKGGKGEFDLQLDFWQKKVPH